jgi:excisionase family DNA binding protein
LYNTTYILFCATLQSIQKELGEAGSLTPSLRLVKEPATIKPIAKENSNTSRKLYKLAEAAAFLNVSESLLYKLTSRKAIPCHRIGKRILFREEQIIKWLKVKEQKPFGNIPAMP